MDVQAVREGDARSVGGAMRLELGSGCRPTPGYVTNDINTFDGIDIVGNPWEIELPSESVEEVLALGVIEHLTYAQVGATFAKVRDWLLPCGEFLFDVPDIKIWARYLVDGTEHFTEEHVLATIYGWQRWPGDEHKSGWDHNRLFDALHEAGFDYIELGLEPFRARGLERNRFDRPADAHIYVRAVR